MAERPRFFYGWVIVCIGFVSGTLVYGIRHSFSVFLPPILDEFAWDRGSTAVMLSLNILIYGFMAPVAGTLGDRWKPRRLVSIGVTILALATASCAFAHELWHFYLFFGVIIPIGTAFSGWPLFAPALANWFTKRRGFAIALGQMSAGLSFTYIIIAEYCISQFGWRNTFFVLAGILIVVPLPLYLLFFHYRPETRGLRPYGVTELHAIKTSRPREEATRALTPYEWTLGRAVRTYQLWLMVSSIFLYWGMGNYLVLAHQVKFSEDMGYSGLFGASVLGLFGIFVVLGQISSSVSDWIGREKTITLASILSVCALVALVSVRDTSQPWLLYLYAFCFGYGTGLYTPTIVAAAADIFHGKHFGGIAGLLLSGMGVGGAVGPWLGGYIYDISGSYRSAFIISMASFCLASLTVWIAAPRHAARLIR